MINIDENFDKDDDTINIRISHLMDMKSQHIISKEEYNILTDEILHKTKNEQQPDDKKEDYDYY